MELEPVIFQRYALKSCTVMTQRHRSHSGPGEEHANGAWRHDLCRKEAPLISIDQSMIKLNSYWTVSSRPDSKDRPNARTHWAICLVIASP